MTYRQLTGDPTIDRQLDALVADLQRRLGDAVPNHEIERVARECLTGQWEEARIRDFIPILAARCARDRLAR